MAAAAAAVVVAVAAAMVTTRATIGIAFVGRHVYG